MPNISLDKDNDNTKLIHIYSSSEFVPLNYVGYIIKSSYRNYWRFCDMKTLFKMMSKRSAKIFAQKYFNRLEELK